MTPSIVALAIVGFSDGGSAAQDAQPIERRVISSGTGEVCDCTTACLAALEFGEE